jgi:hypothetical protein
MQLSTYSAIWAYTLCAAALSVEGSRLARRPPRKRRVAAFTPRSETTIGTGLNSSKRDDIQTMDKQVFRAVVLRRNGTENRVKRRCVLLVLIGHVEWPNLEVSPGYAR